MSCLNLGEMLHLDSVSDPLSSISAKEPDITWTIKIFPNGSAGGLDQLHAQHLKDMINMLSGAHVQLKA
jgi:hypothetical protein